MATLIKRSNPFTKWLRDRSIKKLKYVNDRMTATACNTTLVFVNCGQYFRLKPYSVRIYYRGGITSSSCDTFYRDLYVALEEVRTGQGEEFEKLRDGAEDMLLVRFYNVWVYESDLLVLLKAMKFEYGEFMNKVELV